MDQKQIVCETQDQVLSAGSQAVAAIREENDIVVKIVFPGYGARRGWQDQIARWQALIVEAITQGGTSRTWFKIEIETDTITVRRSVKS